jgi:hypothetical protein
MYPYVQYHCAVPVCLIGTYKEGIVMYFNDVLGNHECNLDLCLCVCKIRPPVLAL